MSLLRKPISFALQFTYLRLREPCAVTEMLRERVVRTRDDPVMTAGKLHRGFNFVEFAIEDTNGLTGHLVFGDADLDEFDTGAFQGAFGGADV